MFSKKVYALIFASIFFIVGCEPLKVGQKDKYEGKVLTILSPDSLAADAIVVRVYEIDGCEYIGNLSPSNRFSYLAHKGNCKFCEKRLEKNDR